MLDSRLVTPERLDALPPDDPEARASRRDLRRLNAVMFHGRILAGLLAATAPRAPRRIVELGCGDALTSLALARRLAPSCGRVALTLVDMQPSVSEATCDRIEALGWSVEVVRADVFDWLGGADRHDVAVANLFLHHFDAAALARLLAGVAAVAPWCVAAEPRRWAPAYLASRAVGLLGANAVTRHDAPASVRAGFRTGELTSAWPGTVAVDRPRGPFTQAFAARSEQVHDHA